MKEEVAKQGETTNEAGTEEHEESAVTPEQESDSPKSASDFARFGLSQNYTEMISVEERVMSIPVRRPPKQMFIRVHPQISFMTFLLESEHDRQTYLVEPHLHAELARELVAKKLHLAIDRENNIFLWKIKLPGPDGTLDSWNKSAHVAAATAVNDWVRVVANMQLGAYDVISAGGQIPEPSWPDLALDEILSIAFEGCIIDSIDHDVVRRLRGEV